MGRCPFCKEKIKRLKLRVVKISTIYYDGKEFDEDEFNYPSETDEEWVCPECDKVLDIEDDGEATAFLNRDDDLGELMVEKQKLIESEENKNADMS